MEHLKKYWWIYILIAAAIIAAWYFFIRKPSPVKSGDSKLLPPGPSIYEAKKSLEDKIISNEHVISIGTRQIDSKSFIQVGVDAEEHKHFVKYLLDNGMWKGYKVDVVVEDKNVPQQKESKKSPDTKWLFKTILQTANHDQKRLAVDINSGDKPIPDQFKAGQSIKLKIHQTADYTYDITGKIVSIDSKRDSMLVYFTGKVTDKAFGEAEIKQ